MTKESVSVEELLRPDGLAAFTALTTVHDDGWGAAWREDDSATRTVTSPTSAAEDPAYDELVRRPLGAAGMLHLCWATGGLPARPENTHPFFSGDYAFAHNGHVSPIEELEELLRPESCGALEGDTDSERYFRFVLQNINEAGDEREGVTRALATLIREFPTSSLNALMLTADHLFAVHVNSRATSPLRALRQMFDQHPEDIPDRHTTEYFAMDYRVGEQGIAVISSGLDEEGWTPVPDDTAVMIDLESREVSRLEPVTAMPEG